MTVTLNSVSILIGIPQTCVPYADMKTFQFKRSSLLAIFPLEHRTVRD